MIIDTMVMAYAMLKQPDFGEEALAVLEKADALVAPASVLSELLSVVWQWWRSGENAEKLFSAYDNASQTWNELIPVEQLWFDALIIAIEYDHSPYDTLFIAAARCQETKLITYDKKLLRLFPNDTVTSRDFLTAGE